MSFKFIITRQIAPEYDISTHQIQNFSGEGAQPPPQTPPPVGSGVDPEGARGAIAPSINIYQGESIFSPPQSFSLFFIFQCTV